MYLGAALGTGIGAAPCQPVERPVFAASLAFVTHTEPDLHNMVQAGIIVGKTGEKLTDRKFSKPLNLRVF